jgi:hypothetical protein
VPEIQGNAPEFPPQAPEFAPPSVKFQAGTAARFKLARRDPIGILPSCEGKQWVSKEEAGGGYPIPLQGKAWKLAASR